MEKTVEYGNYRIRYREISESEIAITDYSGLATNVELPDSIDGKIIVEIDRKAFLSKKNLKTITLPRSVKRIGDWGFAHCDRLSEISIGDKCVDFGKAVFLDCKDLECIWVEGLSEDVGALLGLAVSRLESSYLLNLQEAGNGDWLKKLDSAISKLLEQSDEEGFANQILCGEEDYGSTNKKAYTSDSRSRKVEIILRRLLRDVGLEKSLRDKMVDYLSRHTKGCSHDEAWQVILNKYSHDKKYYDIFFEAGCVTDENLDDMLKEAGENHPEFKASLLKYKEEKMGYSDVFDSLSLSFF